MILSRRESIKLKKSIERTRHQNQLFTINGLYLVKRKDLKSSDLKIGDQIKHPNESLFQKVKGGYANTNEPETFQYPYSFKEMTS